MSKINTIPKQIATSGEHKQIIITTDHLHSPNRNWCEIFCVILHSHSLFYLSHAIANNCTQQKKNIDQNKTLLSV